MVTPSAHDYVEKAQERPHAARTREGASGCSGRGTGVTSGDAPPPLLQAIGLDKCAPWRVGPLEPCGSQPVTPSAHVYI
jgi:hypothetical protein